MDNVMDNNPVLQTNYYNIGGLHCVTVIIVRNGIKKENKSEENK